MGQEPNSEGGTARLRVFLTLNPEPYYILSGSKSVSGLLRPVGACTHISYMRSIKVGSQALGLS